ncbi:MAG: hypothetical protein ACOYMN_13995 [Roseimicrobium sp.]
MLEFLRRQTKPIMTTLAVIIIIAFVFWGGYTQPSENHFAAPTDLVLEVSGTEHTRADIKRIQGLYTIASGLRLPTQRGYFASELTNLQLLHRRQEDGRPLAYENAPVDFAINLIVLREALEELGIYASDEEVQIAVRGMGAFQTNGQYDPELVRNFERNIGSMGFRINDVYDIVRDSLGYQKLQKLIAGNVLGSRKLAEQAYASSHQTIKAATIAFELDTYKKTAQATDEEIKKYYEENKESYKSAEKRAVTYIFFPTPNTEGKSAEETVKLRNQYGERVNKFAEAVLAPKVDFEALCKAELEADKAQAAKDAELAKKEEPKKEEPAKKDEPKKPAPQPQIEYKALPVFEEQTPPAEIKEQFALVSEIFRNDPAIHPVSDPVETEKGYYLFVVTKVEPSQQLELKAVQEKVRDILLAQKASEAMQKAANDAKKKLEDEIKSGKKFEDAAKEAGLTPKVMADFSPSEPPTEPSNAREIAFEARSTAAGTFCKPLSSPTGVTLVHVLAKELRKREEGSSDRSSLATSLDGMMRNDVFQAWFQRRYTDAGIDADVLIRNAMGNH